MNTSIIVAIALAVTSAAATQAQTATPTPRPLAADEAPAGVDLKLTSTDPDYGYSREKPIKVGPESLGVAAERAYLNSLRDEAGKPIKFKRIGSSGIGPYGNILDRYEVQTSTGRRLELYMDMYHADSDPRQQLAPKGLFKSN